MIAERTLKKWRKEALVDKEIREDLKASPNENCIYQLSERILRMTQELLDQHLLRRK